ncbi:unnamed protein product [Staurois parvus]|uniref:Uncharacterized protein n=1 Tax=Staurois parvus TaxID=386267 RepID=A0ABN9HJT5_9NEOB|nr:unnamed protein product [Staurois parvus]
MSEKHLRFVIGPVASGICHVSQVPPYHSQKAPLLAHAHLAPAVKPSAHTTEVGKTAHRWIEEQVRSRCRAERPARYSDTAAGGGNTGPGAPYSLHKTH